MGPAAATLVRRPLRRTLVLAKRFSAYRNVQAMQQTIGCRQQPHKEQGVQVSDTTKLHAGMQLAT